MTKSTLSREARLWSASLAAAYSIQDEAGTMLLKMAAEALDRLREAQAILADEGCCIRDRFNQPRQHPATLVERDARNQILKCMAALRLDMVASDPVGAPPARL